MNRLLILDDNERFAESLRRSVLMFEGYELEFIEISTVPKTAIQMVREASEQKRPFTVLLIDQHLDSNLDGIETMQEMLGIHSDADTIIFTGYDTPEDGLRAYEAGASRYLPKPFKSAELEFVLKELMRSRKVRIDAARRTRQFRVATHITEAAGTSLDLASTMDKVLSTLYDLFDNTKLCVLLYNKRETALHFAPATLKYYHIENPKYLHKHIFPIENSSIACKVAQKALQTRDWEYINVDNVSKDASYLNLNPDTKSECCFSLLNKNHDLLGVLALERDRLNGFDESDLDLIKMAAHHLSLAIERAQQSDELKTKSAIAAQTSWAATLAHELNNEVGNIVNWAWLIQKNAPPDSPMVEWAQNIEEAAHNLSSANPWGKQTPRVIKVDAFIQSYLEKIAPPRGVHVDFDLRAGYCCVKLLPSKLQFIFKQLITNSARAMKEKDLDVMEVIVSSQMIGKNLIEIRYEDFGPGIIDQSTTFLSPHTTKTTGGFGLLFVQQMIEEMNGSISLKPYQPGEGAVFFIRLPVNNIEQIKAEKP